MSTFLKGDRGKVTLCEFNDGSGGDYPVGNELIIMTTKSWSCTITKETTEQTKQGDAERTYLPSYVTATGSATVVYDSTETDNDPDASDDNPNPVPDGAFKKLLRLAVNKADPGNTQISFYPKRDEPNPSDPANPTVTTTKAIRFKAYITGVDMSATTDELQELTFSFQSNGEVSQDI